MPDAGRPPRPAAPVAPDALPHPVTFFVTAGQRALLLRALRTVHRDRATALMTLIDRLGKEGR